MAENIIKSYLVKIGFESDTQAFRKLDQMMAQAEESVTSHTSGMVKKILQAQGAIVGGFTAVTTAIITMADRIAMTDQKYRLMGQRMMLTTESARKLDMIAKALGTSLDEAAWDKETHQSWMQMSGRIDRVTESLGLFSGGKGEAALKGIRQFHNSFAQLSVDLQLLGTGFVSSLFQKLFPDGGVAAMSKVSKWLDDFEGRIPGLADKLADLAGPVLKNTVLLFKDLGEVVKTGALAFSNLIGLISGDSSIEGAAFSWEKFAGALSHVVGWAKRAADVIINLEAATAHTATALSLLMHGDFAGASKFSGMAAEAMSGGAQKRGAQAAVDDARSDLAAAKTPAATAAAQQSLSQALAAQKEENESTHFGSWALGGAAALTSLAGTAASGMLFKRLFTRAAVTAGANAIEGVGAAEGAAGLGVGGMLLGGGALAGLGGVAMNAGHSADWISHYSGLDYLNPAGMSAYNKALYGDPAARPAAPPPPPPPGPWALAGAGLGAAAAGVPGGIAEALRAAAEASGVPLSLLTAQAYQESRFNPNAVGGKGEQGLMQIMPSTGHDLGLVHPFDPGENTKAGAGYLARLHKKYGDWRTALIAYNQGEGSYAKHGAYPSAAAYADKILKDANRREAGSGKQEVNNNISLGGIYITRPNAEPHEIQSAVRDGVRDGLRSQTQFDMAQVAPAW